MKPVVFSGCFDFGCSSPAVDVRLWYGTSFESLDSSLCTLGALSKNKYTSIHTKQLYINLATASMRGMHVSFSKEPGALYSFMLNSSAQYQSVSPRFHTCTWHALSAYTTRKA